MPNIKQLKQKISKINNDWRVVISANFAEDFRTVCAEDPKTKKRVLIYKTKRGKPSTDRKALIRWAKEVIRQDAEHV